VLLFSVTLAVYRTLGVNTIYNIRRWRRSGLESQLYITSRFWNCFIFLLLLCATLMHYYSTNSPVMLLTHLRFGQLRRVRTTPFRLNIPAVPHQPQFIRLYARLPPRVGLAPQRRRGRIPLCRSGRQTVPKTAPNATTPTRQVIKTIVHKIVDKIIDKMIDEAVGSVAVILGGVLGLYVCSPLVKMRRLIRQWRNGE
jgi:hypothetical protein